MARRLRFHHCRQIAHSRHGIVEPVRTTSLSPEPDCALIGACELDEWHLGLHLEAAYAWVAERVGFWPLFVAVGESDDDRRMTTYDAQWRRQTLALEGRPSRALFSWPEPPGELVYMDYMEWHIVLNAVRKSGPDPHRLTIAVDDDLGYDLETAIFRPSWTARRWLTYAARDYGVQAVVPTLDLRTAEEIWVPNQRGARALRNQGFDPDRLRVQRLTVGR